MSKPGDWFSVLGELARTRLTGVDRTSEDFVNACVDVLGQLPRWRFAWENLADARIWQCREQTFPERTFADFALTVWRQGDVCLDIYVWNGSDTLIHDHHFAGAFRVVEGSYHQTNFRFDRQGELAPGWWQGKLEVQASREIEINETHPIHMGDGLIHRVLHYRLPSVTLCLRTPPLQSFIRSYWFGHQIYAARSPAQKLFRVARGHWEAKEPEAALASLRQLSPAEAAFCIGKFHHPEEDWIDLVASSQPDYGSVLQEFSESALSLTRQRLAMLKLLGQGS